MKKKKDEAIATTSIKMLDTTRIDKCEIGYAGYIFDDYTDRAYKVEKERVFFLEVSTPQCLTGFRQSREFFIGELLRRSPLFHSIISDAKFLKCRYVLVRTSDNEIEKILDRLSYQKAKFTKLKSGQYRFDTDQVKLKDYY